MQRGGWQGQQLPPFRASRWVPRAGVATSRRRAHGPRTPRPSSQCLAPATRTGAGAGKRG